MQDKHWLNLRRVIVFLISCAFIFQFWPKISRVISNESTCLCAYDGYGYYMYLNRFFEHEDLKFDQGEAQKIQDQYCDSILVYQLYTLDNGKSINIYQMGQAFVELPAYLVGDVCARIFGYKTDGFSKPYHISFLLNALAFILLGIRLVVKISKLYFNEAITSLILILLFIGTNYWSIATTAYALQHIYLFVLIGYFFYYLVRFTKSNQLKYLVYSAFLLGLVVCIRPVHVVLGIIPLLLLRDQFDSFKRYWKNVLLFPLLGLLVNIPQLLYWKLTGDKWIFLNLHVEELIIIDPHLMDFLFSYKKGWLVYSPVFLVLIPGFYYLLKNNRKLFVVLFSSSVLSIWFFASWECWWYSYSFGSRAMIDVYALLIIPLGFGLQFLLNKKFVKYVSIIFLSSCLYLSILQSWQYEEGILDREHMTKEQYWFIFGKWNIPDFSNDRLSINRGDTSWPENLVQKKLDFAQIDTLQIIKKHSVNILGKSDKLLLDMELLSKFKTDEVNMQLELVYSNSNNHYVPELRLETHSIYNVYNWQTIQLLPNENGTNFSDTIKYRFNLPVINHRYDKMQIYVINKGNDREILLNYINLKGIRLKRN